MRVETQLSAFLDNRAGVLADLAADLGRHGICIRALTVANLVDHAVIRLVVDQPQKALHLLGDRGVLALTSEVLAIDMPDRAARLGLTRVHRRARGARCLGRDVRDFGFANAARAFLRSDTCMYATARPSDAGPLP